MALLAFLVLLLCLACGGIGYFIGRNDEREDREATDRFEQLIRDFRED